ncbi:MAG: hypothetical protein AAFZ38_00175 [Myxococcota bacterium]
MDAIFGSGKPSYVDLSEDSLREIQNRVREEIIRDAEFELLSQFQSLEDLLEAYHAHVNFTGVPNLTMQLDLLGRYKDAINHRALNPDNNSDFFYLADTFALLAAVSVAVQTERSLANQIPESEISNTANGLADTLDYMLSQKRATDLPLREDCEMVSSPTDQYREDYCWVEDANGYIIASSYVHDDPWSDDRWDRKRFGAVQDYMEENFYRLEDVVATLRSM